MKTKYNIIPFKLWEDIGNIRYDFEKGLNTITIPKDGVYQIKFISNDIEIPEEIYEKEIFV